MGKLSKSRWFVGLVGAVFAVLPQVGRAQAIDARTLMRAQQQGQNTNLYGENPFDSTDEEGAEVQDTTRKERRIRKPLESYFFNDSIRALPNFAWNISRDYNRIEFQPIDTTLTDFRIDYPFYREGVGEAAVGGLGQASIPLNYFARPEFFDFGFAQAYHV